MICNVCHTEIPDDAAFCPVCGSPVTATNNTTAQAQEQPQPQAAPEQSNTDSTQQQPASKRCPVCGNYIPAEANVCPICGANVSGNTYTNAAPQTGVPTGYNQRSKLAAALLAIFLGAFGIHNFYLGYTNKAIAQLVLGILCCGTVSGIWGFVEGIMILTESIRVDGNGMPLGK